MLALCKTELQPSVLNGNKSCSDRGAHPRLGSVYWSAVLVRVILPRLHQLSDVLGSFCYVLALAVAINTSSPRACTHVPVDARVVKKDSTQRHCCQSL